MSGAHILLVEDDAVLRDLLQRNLAARTHQVQTAENAHSALAHLQETSFDLVILDINLPDQTGWEVLRIAQQRGWLCPQMHNDHQEGKRSAQGATLPVVVLSAVRVSLARLREFHPLAYLPKPFPMHALLHLAAEIAERRNQDAFPGREDLESHHGPELDEEASLPGGQGW
jgi:DNA-binding response OmpR family regulator